MAKINKNIEYLRAFAIILTLVGHLERLFPWRTEGYPAVTNYVIFWGGVDLFFCRSGYVVSRVFIETLDWRRKGESPWLHAQAFWVRRFYRLLPSAWLWIAIPTILSVTFNSSMVFSSFISNFKSVIAVITFSGNFAQRNGGGLGINLIY